jgi:polyisoprenoid-binding protein YceI
MKNTYLTLAVLALILSVGWNTQAQKKTPSPNRPTVTMQVDVRSSTVNWTGRKVLGKHNGTINIAKGNLTLENNAITKGRFDIDMKSIVDLDLTDAETNAKLTGHLKSDDFFSVDKFPLSTLVITGAKPTEGAMTAVATHIITGDLTIKGVTNTVSFPARIITDGRSLTATATIDIDRTKWNIKYGSGSFFDNLGDKAIKDVFTLEITIKAGA